MCLDFAITCYGFRIILYTNQKPYLSPKTLILRFNRKIYPGLSNSFWVVSSHVQIYLTSQPHRQLHVWTPRSAFLASSPTLQFVLNIAPLLWSVRAANGLCCLGRLCPTQPVRRSGRHATPGEAVAFGERQQPPVLGTLWSQASREPCLPSKAAHCSSAAEWHFAPERQSFSFQHCLQACFTYNLAKQNIIWHTKEVANSR